MKENMQIVFGLLGGLAVFIYGMNLMSESLQKAAGEKMKSILALLTKNRIMGVIAGALVTAVLQSSSATTVMAIGFVSAGLMSLPQAISIIFGANIGTTMTAQIIAFKITDYIYAFIFIGFILTFICKSERIKSIGQTIFAFGLLFLGIETMGDVMKPLASSPFFVDLIAKVADMPVLGVVVGTMMTLVVQSSSATIAVLQNFASQAGPDGVTSILGLTGAIPILLGDNIGTTITALLASVGQPRDARRTAVAHCIFNLSGALIFIWLIKPFAYVIQMISPKGPEVQVISRQIANAHTSFNIVMTLIWIPLIWLMVKIVMKVIPDAKTSEKREPSRPQFLDDKLIGQPTVALSLARKEITRCSEMAGETLQKLISLVKGETNEQLEEVLEQGHDVGKLTEQINMFSSGSLTEKQTTQTAGLMYMLGDVDRVNGLSMEIAESVREKKEQKYKYSKEAMRDLTKSLEQIQGMYREAIQVLMTGSTENAKKIVKKKEKVLDLTIHMGKSHVERVGKGKCSSKLTVPFNHVLQNIGRMGNCCVNIADAVLAQSDLNEFTAFVKEEN